MSKAYPSNLTHTQYEFLSDLIPEPKPGGRKRKVDIWEVLNAIFASFGGRSEMESIAPVGLAGSQAHRDRVYNW